MQQPKQTSLVIVIKSIGMKLAPLMLPALVAKYFTIVFPGGPRSSYRAFKKKKKKKKMFVCPFPTDPKL